MIEIVGTILAALLAGSIFKAKPYCLWIKGNEAGTVWANSNPQGNSARRCKKAKRELILQGIPADRLMILPKGITPPKVV